jgi:deoxyhypusine monooxygenase
MAVHISSESEYKSSLCKKYNEMFEDRTCGTQKLESIMEVLGPNTRSILLRHEACYILGQMKDPRSVPLLKSLLEDPSEHEITRHEAAEALGAIGESGSLECLCMYTSSDSVPLRETCELGVDRLQASGIASGDFNTVDPVAVEKGSVAATESQVDFLLAKLLNPETDLPGKYKCLFSLRTITDVENKPSVKAVKALGEALRSEQTSALLRHEIAFVIGQMAFGMCATLIPDCVSSLSSSVENSGEHSMVRHEAAIALGSIAGENTEIEEFLTRIGDLAIDESNQDEAIVIESCLVARESLRYWRKHSCC